MECCGGWLFKSGFPEKWPLAFQEVDIGVKDRRENPLFWEKKLATWISGPRFGYLWTRPKALFLKTLFANFCRIWIQDSGAGFENDPKNDPK